MLIYHIVLPEVWEAFDTGVYRHASLADEGFIHCSFAGQVDAVINRYYKNAPRVFVVEIDTGRLMSRTILEPSTANEIYPHIYGPINRTAVVRVTERRKHDR